VGYWQILSNRSDRIELSLRSPILEWSSLDGNISHGRSRTYTKKALPKTVPRIGISPEVEEEVSGGSIFGKRSCFETLAGL